MSPTKQTFVAAFALFSLFFGAGNLILPPYLGYQAGTDWMWVALGFVLSAVCIPILAIYGHARLQGNMMDFGKKVSLSFALGYSLLVYAIAVALPAPRTASVTYEMALEPYFEFSPLLLSTIYFVLVFFFVINRNRILSLIGKYLTPLILVILAAIIFIGLSAAGEGMHPSLFDNNFSAGILEGYQTFDAIGGVVVGGVIVISFQLQGKYDYKQTKHMIGRAGLLAGLGLFLVYAGLIALGAHFNASVDMQDRSELLTYLSQFTLGSIGAAALSVLVALACFTTAVGIIAGTADFVKDLAGGSQKVFLATAVFACAIGVLMGQFNVHYIIMVAIPALMFIYPITIVLILLNVLPDHLASKKVFRWTIATTFVFSIPSFVLSLKSYSFFSTIQEMLPLGTQQMGWVLPALLTFALVNLFDRVKK